MTIPSWLAPNASLAEPRAKRYAERIAEYVNAEIIDFWPSEPTVHQVFSPDQKEHWNEAWFCLQLKGKFPRFPIDTINGWRKTIKVWNVEWSELRQCTEILISGRVLY